MPRKSALCKCTEEIQFGRTDINIANLDCELNACGKYCGEYFDPRIVANELLLCRDATSRLPDFIVLFNAIQCERA